MNETRVATDRSYTVDARGLSQRVVAIVLSGRIWNHGQRGTGVEDPRQVAAAAHLPRSLSPPRLSV